jgi:hypothetical protein
MYSQSVSQEAIFDVNSSDWSWYLYITIKTKTAPFEDMFYDGHIAIVIKILLH